MSVLVIYAHPPTKGHNAVLLDEVRSQLRDRKEPFTVLDLYAEGFDPVLRAEEHYTAGKRFVAPQTERYQRLLKAHERIIIIAPVWWAGVPAVLKGFFDKVLTNRFAFEYRPLPFSFFGLKSRPHGLLRGRAAVLLTMGGPSLPSWLYGQRPGSIITRNTLGFCGIRAKAFVTGRCLRLDQRKEAQLRRKARRAVAWLCR